MKSFFFKSFLLVALLSCLNALSFAQGTQREGDDPPPAPPDPFQIEKESGKGGGDGFCKYVKSLNVYVTNLDLYGVPEINGTYTITSQAPHIYLEVLVDGSSEILTPVTDFVYVGKYDIDHQIDSISLYVVEVSFEDEQFPGCDGPLHSFTMEARLLTTVDPNSPNIPSPELPTGYSYYPVIDHALPNGLFSCSLFSFTQCACDDSCSVIIPSFSSTQECGCSDDPGDDPQEGYNSPDPGNNDLLKSSKVISVSPNPFQSSFTLNYQAAEAGTLSISLFSSNGQELINQQELVHKGSNTIDLNVNKLPAGIYMLQVRDSEQNTSFLKLLKQ